MSNELIQYQKGGLSTRHFLCLPFKRVELAQSHKYDYHTVDLTVLGNL